MKLFKIICIILFTTTTAVFPLSFSKEKSREELVKKSTEQITFSPKPSWVKEVDYATENYEENIDSSGVARLLINRQYNLEQRVYYIREVNKIISTTALTDGCRIPISFNFQNQDLIIHEIKIIREGEIIDKLLTAKRKYFYPSSGNITEVFFYIDNLHIGDVVDISYSMKYKDTYTMYQLFGDTFPIKDCSLYKKIAYSCLSDKDRPLFWKTHLFHRDPICTFRDTYKEYSWEINDYDLQFFPADDFPKISSHQSTREPSITISITQWSDIAKYCATLLQEKSHFSPVPPENIVALIQEWQKSYPSLEDQILAAIQLASDDIYYLSIPDEEEEHYLTPYSPDKTLQNHYGDCKDKTSLLIAILELLGVEAHPVLIHTEKTYELRNELPNPCFDHLITHIEYGGKSYFIDPTLPLLGGTLDTYQIPDYGYGLIVKEDSSDLVPITRNFLSKIQSTATLLIQDADVIWDHTTQSYFNEADIVRRELIPGYIDKRGKAILYQFSNEFPDATITYASPLEIEDDRRANVITNSFSLSLENLGKKTSKGISYDLTPFVGDMIVAPTYEIDLSKALSLEMINGFNEEIYRVIDIHCDMPPTIEEKKVRYRDENMFYSLTLEKISDTHIQLILHQKFFTNYIEADQLPHFFEKLQEFKKHLFLTIEIPT